MLPSCHVPKNGESSCLSRSWSSVSCWEKALLHLATSSRRASRYTDSGVCGSWSVNWSNLIPQNACPDFSLWKQFFSHIQTTRDKNNWRALSSMCVDGHITQGWGLFSYDQLSYNMLIKNQQLQSLPLCELLPYCCVQVNPGAVLWRPICPYP